MKKIIDFIGNAIVKLFECSLIIILPLAIVCGAIVGYIQKLCGVRYQTFSRVYEGLGEMTSIGTSEKKCKYWSQDIELGDWKKAKLLATRDILENQNHLSTVAKEFKKIQQNISDVIATIKNEEVYKEILSKEGIDLLAANDEVTAELHIGEKGNLDPYIAVCYNSDHYFVCQCVQDGEMTALSVCDSNE